MNIHEIIIDCPLDYCTHNHECETCDSKVPAIAGVWYATRKYPIGTLPLGDSIKPIINPDSRPPMIAAKDTPAGKLATNMRGSLERIAIRVLKLE